MLKLANPDLTQHPPRSPRVRLGGFAHLPRLLDKARAFAAGKNGEFHYNCPLDRKFFEFTGIDHEALLEEVKKGGSDTAMLAWVKHHTKRIDVEVAAWSLFMDKYGSGGADGHGWFSETIRKLAAERTDITSFSDLLDLDDYVSFGGQG